MKEVALEPGYCLGIGGSNARAAACHENDIRSVQTIDTPYEHREFFKWLARHTLNAADQGSAWLVAGFPGPVSPDGTLAGPMTNIPPLSYRESNVIHEMAEADPAIPRLIEDGFTFVAVNDGELAAQSAAHRIGSGIYRKVAAIIIGTGVGGGIVQKDGKFDRVYRADKTDPLEIGHLIRSDNPIDTYENAISGTALFRRFMLKPEEMPDKHTAWAEVGQSVGQIAMTLSLLNGTELIVPTGGVGAGAASKYFRHTQSFIESVEILGNKVQRDAIPYIHPAPANEHKEFELYGAEGVMRDYLTRPA